MTNAADPIQALDRLRRHAIATLVPFFADSPDCDPETARLAAEGMLDGYSAATPKELQLSTQIIAFGWASRACLRAAVAAKNLSVRQILALQDDAIGLDRSSQKTTKALEAQRKERARKPKVVLQENIRWDEGTFQLAINHAQEKLTDANASLAAYTASLLPGAAQPEPRRWSSGPIKPSVPAPRTRKWPSRRDT